MKILKPIILGKICSTYGIKGWIKVISYTEKSNNIFNYNPLFLKYNKNYKKIELDNWKEYKNQFIIKIKDYNNCEGLKKIINCNIVIDKSQLLMLKNQYYFIDLINCLIINIYGQYIGKVINVLRIKKNDYLLVKITQNNIKDNEILLPLKLGKYIMYINIIKKEIKLNININIKI